MLRAPWPLRRGAATIHTSATLQAHYQLDPMTATVLTGQQIDRFRARVLLSALKLETLGMRRNGPSAYSIVKKEYGLKGSKQSVYDQFKAMVG